MVISYSQSRKAPSLNLWLEIAFSVLCIIGLAYSIPGWAHADERLTDIFYTKSFQGSWEVINKFNWMGFLLQALISSVCVIGLSSVLYQRLVSMLYLSGRATWDAVYEYKEADSGGKFFGLGKTFSGVFNGNRGVGLDAAIGFIYSILPNVKYHSDFNPNRNVSNVNEDDSIGTYMLKTAMPTIMIVFFFSMGFDGSLAQGYGMVVNGFSAISDKAVSTNLEGFIRKKLNTGESYDFTLGSSNLPTAKFSEKIAKDLYSKVLSRMDILDTQTRLTLGNWIETKIFNDVMGGQLTDKEQRNYLSSMITVGYKGDKSLDTNSDFDALRYELVVNTNPTGAMHVKYNYKLSDLLRDSKINVTTTGTLADSLYAHLIITKAKVSEADFFVKPATTTSIATPKPQ